MRWSGNQNFLEKALNVIFNVVENVEVSMMLKKSQRKG